MSINQEALYLIDAWQRGADSDDYASEIAALRQTIEHPEKQECETCAAKRKRLLNAGFLKSPLRGEDHVG